MVSQIEYSVSFTLEELEDNLRSEFLKKIKDSLHVDSLSEALVLKSSFSSEVVLYKNGSR